MKLFFSVCIALTSLKALSQDSIKTGFATQYAKYFNGRKTATGEIYRSSKLTCASNTFKLNTRLRITSISSGKSVEVLVNDRMHPRMARKGRIVDLSNSAAHILGFTEGIIKVKAEII